MNMKLTDFIPQDLQLSYDTTCSPVSTSITINRLAFVDAKIWKLKVKNRFLLVASKQYAVLKLLVII